MNCPKCGADSGVSESRPSDDKVRRRRYCPGCSHKFTTYEITSDHLDWLKAEREPDLSDLVLFGTRDLLSAGVRHAVDSFFDWSNYPPENWPRLVKTLRLELGLSTKDLAEAVGTSTYSVHQLELGNNCSYKIVVEILEFLFSAAKKLRAEGVKADNCPRSQDVESADP